MTWVRVKLALEGLPEGATLEVILRGAEPLKNIPLSATEDGHALLSLEALDDGRALLTLRVHH